MSSRRKKRGSKSQQKMSVRNLLKTQLPKASLTLSSSAGVVEGRADHIYRIEGCEVIGELRTSAWFATRFSPFLNPGRSEFAPRLSAIALAFERFRFRKLCVHYHTACPATRSGAIGLMIDFDPSDAAPVALVEVAENEAGMVGTVAEDLEVSATWPASDPFYLMTPDVSVSGEPQWRYPGRLFVSTVEAVTADDNLLAGFISISYDIELLRLRPTVQAIVSGPPKDATQSFTSTATDILWDFDNIIGWWDWFQSPATVPGSSLLTYENSLVAKPGDYDLSYLLDFFAPSSEHPIRSDEYEYREDEKGDFHLVGRPDSPPATAVVRRGPSYRWRNPQFHVSKKVRAEYPSLRDHVMEPPVLGPTAAGDITVTVLARDQPTNVDATISTELWPIGAFAGAVMDSFLFHIDNGSRIHAKVAATGSEHRVLKPATSNLQVSPRAVLE